MALELKDFRGKITVETDAALEAESRFSGRDRADIAREILHAWATKKIHEARLLTSICAAQGIVGDSQGIKGTGRK